MTRTSLIPVYFLQMSELEPFDLYIYINIKIKRFPAIESEYDKKVIKIEKCCLLVP